MSQPSQLNINTSIVAFSDVGVTNNPTMRNFDWGKNLNGLTVYNPKAEQLMLAARATKVLFSDLRSTSFGANTSIRVDYLTDNTYRLWFNSGTDPVFATDIPLSFGSTQMTVSSNANQTVTLTAVSAIFTGITANSYLYIYSPTDHAAAAFSPLNSGAWVVLQNVTNTILTLARPTGTDFSSADETVTCAAANNMICYTPTDIQANDKVRLLSPFNVNSRSTFVITSVTSKWLDILSTAPLAEETVTAGTTGMAIYGSSKRFTRIEADQRVSVQFNGASDSSQEIEPWTPGDRKLMGWQERIGPVWSISVTNLTNVPVLINLFTAE